MKKLKPNWKTYPYGLIGSGFVGSALSLRDGQYSRLYGYASLLVVGCLWALYGVWRDKHAMPRDPKV